MAFQHHSQFLNCSIINYSNRIAKNLLETQRVRTGAYRAPYPPDGEQYRLFESQFKHTATKDQQACFEVRSFNQYYAVILFVYYNFFSV